MIMITDSELDIKSTLLKCPFSHICILPKNQNTCYFPEFKMCPEHTQKLAKYKVSK